MTLAAVPADDGFLASLLDTQPYSIAGLFHDRHPDLVDDVVARRKRSSATVWAPARAARESTPRPPSRRD